MTGQGRVVRWHARNNPANAAYIGRGSPFGNPFVIGKHGDRETVIARYRTWFYARIASDSQFKRQVLALRGRDLGCYCAPLACHGDVILQYLRDQAAAAPTATAPPHTPFLFL